MSLLTGTLRLSIGPSLSLSCALSACPWHAQAEASLLICLGGHDGATVHVLVFSVCVHLGIYYFFVIVFEPFRIGVGTPFLPLAPALSSALAFGQIKFMRIVEHMLGSKAAEQTAILYWTQCTSLLFSP